MADWAVDLAERLEPGLRATFLRVVGETRASYPGGDAQALIERYDLVGLYRMLWEWALQQQIRGGSEMEGALLDAAYQAWEDSAEFVPVEITPTIRFDNLVAQDWARGHAAELVPVDGFDYALLRRIIQQVQDGALRPADAVRQIADFIPVAHNHRENLEAWEEGLRGQGFSEQRIAELRQARVAHLVNWRANTIVRTESIRASTIGQLLLWQQQQEEGWIDRGAGVRWVVTPDDRLCPLCAPMDGQVVLLRHLLMIMDKAERWGAWHEVTSWPGFPRYDDEEKPILDSVLADPSLEMFVSRYKGIPVIPEGRYGRDPLRQTTVEMLAARAKGLRFRKKEQRLLGPPLHPQCRCRLVLVPDEKEALDWRQARLKLFSARDAEALAIAVEERKEQARKRREALAAGGPLPPLRFPPDMRTKKARRLWLAEQWDELLGLKKGASFNDCDPNLVLEALNQVRYLRGIAPDALAEIDLYVGDYRGQAWHPVARKFGPRDWAHCGNGYLGLSAKFWGDPERFAGSLRRSANTGWHPSLWTDGPQAGSEVVFTDTIPAVIDHELGHAFSSAMAKAGGTVAQQIYRQVYEELRDKAVREMISGYAIERTEEGFAELFSVAVSPQRLLGKERFPFVSGKRAGELALARGLADRLRGLLWLLIEHRELALGAVDQGTLAAASLLIDGHLAEPIG